MHRGGETDDATANDNNVKMLVGHATAIVLYFGAGVEGGVGSAVPQFALRRASPRPLRVFSATSAI
ncbi:MAG: hypothetical protein LAO09_01110 [Acidobacteriia bacterium]|nr:hypothetical protein [Terriglobia bacterium]